MAELRHRAAFEPAQQLGAIAVGAHRRIGEHRGAHRLPVGDRGAHIGKRGFERIEQTAPGARVAAFEFHIDDRLACAVLAGVDRGQMIFRVALDRHHRVEDAVHGKALRARDLRGRIDEEGHVVVDDDQAHPAAAPGSSRNDGWPGARSSDARAANSPASASALASRSSLSPGSALPCKAA